MRRDGAVISDGDIRITDQVAIPAREVRFRFATSGGPGGQHANRSATQVELLFDVALAVERERPWPMVAPAAS